MTKVHQVRREFGEPFRDVVAGLAAMRYSKRATAQALSINPSYFIKLCERYKVIDKFPIKRKDYNEMCKPPGHPKGKKIHQPQRYTDAELLKILSGYSLHITKHRYDYLQQKPCSDTIFRRFGSWRKAKRLAHGLL